MCIITPSVLASRLIPTAVERMSELMATRMVPPCFGACARAAGRANSATVASVAVRSMEASLGGELGDGFRGGVGGDRVFGEVHALVGLARDPHLAELGVDDG